MQTQIPIYRAKKIDSDEYVIGWLANPTPSLYYIFFNNCGYLNINNEVCIQDDERAEIDPSTLAVHFPNMIDKNVEKIFASLNDNCIGASIVDRTTKDGRIYDSIDVGFHYINHLDVNLHDYNTPELTLEVVGIKKC